MRGCLGAPAVAVEQLAIMAAMQPCATKRFLSHHVEVQIGIAADR